MQKIGDIVDKFKIDNRDKYVSREFQKYGYDLAVELEHPKGVPLYIKLSKEVPRGLIESARSFVKDASNVRSKSRLFMWKLKQLRTEKQLRDESKTRQKKV